MEQNLSIARMSNPTAPTGVRHVISRPRESGERDPSGPRRDPPAQGLSVKFVE